jgi:hypothetical protein
MVAGVVTEGIFELMKQSQDPNVVNSVRDSIEGTKSIAARARHSIFTYPVIYSSGLTDYKIAFKITKFLELQYGLFTMLTAGASPVSNDGDINAKLSALGGENLEYVETNVENKVKSEEFYKGMLSEQPYYHNEYEFIKSEEAVNPNDPLNPDTNNAITPGGDNNIAVITKASELKLQKANPTVITLSYNTKHGKISLPVGIKAYTHFITQTDLSALFDAAIEDKRILNRFIKLSSGEISFFKDFLFNMDKAKRDTALYARFGQHPWYQQFLQRKSMNGAKRVAMIIGSLFNPALKSLIQGSSNFLPTATIMCTRDELERSSKMKYSFLLKEWTKTNSTLKEILNRLMLLCIGVYDAELESCTFYFNGFKEPMLVPLSDMAGSDDKDSTKDLIGLMTMMMKRGIM